ncbi:unnamed protein product [Mytilus edulis]|uniref:Uncharacterized protein n=1 Tax=Mytilus edulis TaxID=6550 RepID=A0A8S3QY56_MYTED|nr:unnamed protein product [Mytilus edulis]
MSYVFASRRQTVHNNEASTCPNYESRSISAQHGEGRSKIKISLPVNALLEYFTKTENRTELYAYFGYVADVSRNRRKAIPTKHQLCNFLTRHVRQIQLEKRSTFSTCYTENNKENKTDDDRFDILLFSGRKGQLRLEILSDVFNDTAFQVAKNLQNFKEGCNVRKLKDVIQLQESEERTVQLSDFCKNKNTQQKIERNNSKYVNKETVDGQPSEDMEEINIDDQYSSQIHEYNKLICIQNNVISKYLQKKGLSMTNDYCEEPDLTKSKTKVFSHRVVPTKTKKSKVKTQTKHPEWKIYLQPEKMNLEI